VIGELVTMRDRKALLLSGGQQKLVALGARCHRNEMPAARRAIRGSHLPCPNGFQMFLPRSRAKV
jgi:hypothetical protein